MSDLKARLLAAFPTAPVREEFEGVAYWLKPWTAAERMAFAAEHNAHPDRQKTFWARLVAWSLCDESGALVFGPDGAAEVGGALNGAFVEAAADRVIALQRPWGADPKAKAPSAATPG